VAERRWYRLHWGTLLGLCIVCTAFAWSDCVGEPWLNVDVVVALYGWPFPHELYPEAWWYCPWRDCPWWNCRALNFGIQIAGIAAVVFALETTLLTITSVLSVVFALAQIDLTWVIPDCELDPTGSLMRWPVRAPILFALGCTMYTAGWLVARLARSLYALAVRRPA